MALSRTCVQCGAPLRGKQVKTCSEECGYLYKLEYWRQREQKRKHACAGCGKPCGRQARWCIDCGHKAQIGVPFDRRRVNPPRHSQMLYRASFGCPLCSKEIRPFIWHGMTLARCPECGLETTYAELERIRLQEVLAA